MDLEIGACMDSEGSHIACPEIRLQASLALDALLAHGPELKVCYAN